MKSDTIAALAVGEVFLALFQKFVPESSPIGPCKLSHLLGPTTQWALLVVFPLGNSHAPSILVTFATQNTERATLYIPFESAIGALI
jgi:hypothetical protein